MEATNPENFDELVSNADPNLSDDEMEIIYSKAVSRARLRLSLYIHSIAYALVILLLVVINLLASPGTLWVVWPFFGWGAALALHWATVLKLVPAYEAMTEKEIARQIELRANRRDCD